MARGLRYLHSSHGVLHRDLKPANVLLFREKQLPTPQSNSENDEIAGAVQQPGPPQEKKKFMFKAKVADFGLSRVNETVAKNIKARAEQQTGQNLLSGGDTSVVMLPRESASSQSTPVQIQYNLEFAANTIPFWFLLFLFLFLFLIRSPFRFNFRFASIPMAGLVYHW